MILAISLKSAFEYLFLLFFFVVVVFFFVSFELVFVFDVCDDTFRYRKADGTRGTARYFKENVFTLYEANADGSFGTGLWGPTPEENEYRAFVEQENRSFVTLSMWATPDPVAVWTKASGMFVPVAPKANGGIVIGTKWE